MLSFTFLNGSSFRGKIAGTSNTFIQACKDGPDYVCNCCNRLMYRKTVTEFSGAKYLKAPTQILAAISMPSSSYHMTAGKSWICRTCNSSLKRGLMPIQSKLNNLQLHIIPDDLLELNPLETCLISLRIPFL